MNTYRLAQMEHIPAHAKKPKHEVIITISAGLKAFIEKYLQDVRFTVKEKS